MPDHEFDYTHVAHREGPYANYLREEIMTLLIEARTLREIYEELKKRCDGLSYQRIQEDHDYRQVLLGGVNDDGSYAENSAARLYRDVLGIRFSDHDDAAAKAAAGATIDTDVVVEQTPTIDFVETVIEHCESTLELGHEVMADWAPQDSNLPDPSPPSAGLTDLTRYRELLDDPGAFVEQLEDFITALQEILPNYDERALFIIQLEDTPRFYLEEVYPGLEDPHHFRVSSAEELWDQYETFLGLEETFKPNIDDETNHQNYRIYSYEAGSIGAHLRDLYQTIWEGFVTDADGEQRGTVRESLMTAFSDLTDYREAYRANAVAELEKSGGWTRPEQIEGFHVVNATSDEVAEYQQEHRRRKQAGYSTFESIRATTKATYEIDGLVIRLSTFHEWGQSQSGNSWTDTSPPDHEDTTFNLPTLLNWLAPTLFLLDPIEYQLDIDAETMELTKR